jgi:hypothetical protein
VILTVRVAVSALLAIAAGGCATPTFEDRLGQLELLKSRGTITEDEHAIMRRRLIETFDPATLRVGPDTSASSGDAFAALGAPPAPPADPPDPRSLVPPPQAEPEGPAEPLTAGWVAGFWRGTHTGGPEWYWDVSTTLEVSATGDHIEWVMVRRFRFTGGVAVAEASGTAVVGLDGLEMIGIYTNSTQLASEGTPIQYELRRVGDALEGFALDAHTATRALQLRRAIP